MHTFRPIVFAAALAGLIVGLVITVAQQFGTVPLILAAEVYEKAAEEAAVATPDTAEPAMLQAADGQSAPISTAAEPVVAEHEHSAEAWEPRDGFERNAYTALFNIVDWVGFGLLLTGAIVLMRRPIEWREGFLWGLAGFVAFVWAPSLGLPPELPGIPAAELGPRQVWWIGTVLATAISLGLVAFYRTPAAAVGAIVLFALPHVIGAPALESVETNVPETLSHQFSVAVILTTLLSWSLLGGLVGYFYRRFAAAEGVPSFAAA